MNFGAPMRKEYPAYRPIDKRYVKNEQISTPPAPKTKLDYESTRNAQFRRFNELYRSIPLQQLKADYAYELKFYSIKVYEPHARGGRLTAAMKHYRTNVMLCFIFSHVDKQILLTPGLVKKLFKAWFGRAGANALLVEIFACLYYLDMAVAAQISATKV